MTSEKSVTKFVKVQNKVIRINNAFMVATFGSSDNWDDNPFITTHNNNDNVPTQTYTQQYTYDAVGNITQLQHVGSSQGSYTRDYYYNGGNNQCYRTVVGSDIYNYNYHAQHGFLLDLPHLSVLNWNWKEEIAASSKQFVSGGDIPETTYYQYDSKGKRLRKITENFAYFGNTPTVKNSRVYIEGYEYFSDNNSGGVCESLSLIDEGRRFVMYEMNQGPDFKLTRYQHPNHQSSCNLETDENGKIICYEEYHPFGTTSYQATDASIQANAKRYRYTGMERDDETGLNYHNARYYIPWLGRWMNPDPIGIGDGVNVYAYCGNNPLGHVDKKGTQAQENSRMKILKPEINFKGDLPKKIGDLGNTLSKLIITFEKGSFSAELKTDITYTKAFQEKGKNGKTIETQNPGLFKNVEIHEQKHFEAHKTAFNATYHLEVKAFGETKGFDGNIVDVADKAYSFFKATAEIKRKEKAQSLISEYEEKIKQNPSKEKELLTERDSTLEKFKLNLSSAIKEQVNVIIKDLTEQYNRKSDLLNEHDGVNGINQQTADANQDASSKKYAEGADILWQNQKLLKDETH